MVLVVGLVLVVLVAGLVWALQRRLIYFPDRSAPPLPPGARTVDLHTSDGLRLQAWLFEPPPGVPDRKVSILVAPGNAGNRGDRLPLATGLANRGLTVLLLDYRGYGGNPGRPSEQGLARDVRAARVYLVGLQRPIVYLGESLGAAVATGLAAEHPSAGLVLRSPFADLPAVGREHYPFLPVRLLARDRFPVRELISRITVPTVVVYGTADEVVPAGQSVGVAERAGGPVRLVAVEGAGHNDAVLVAGPPLIDAVDDLVREP
ncbi:alpha/beta hydrolase [Paractinoplanes lichenicola]|uniref:Alpha/beta hydrolase n=1 Tax=Paractinoplanes lichenicola TaxID=2802976 RepID=A0ABS1VVI7_9ACTN|nr:alpha/beta hydrolase [Actinoplanes lichenicola]MBL7258497.1 alpha/beta hydrolase [Actinoplanes lichenicola]